MERKRPARGRAGQGCIRRASYGPAGRGAQGLDAADLEALARSLGGAKRVGDGWSCRCPLHDDRHASLSLGLGEGGRLLARCHAGCDQREVFRAVVDRSRELGLLAAPARTGRPKAVKAAVPAPRPKAADVASAGARATQRRRTSPAYNVRTGELAADALARFAAARRIVDREGLFVEVTTRNGEVVRFVHPGIRIMQSERDAAMHYLRQLGTTPKARGALRRIGSEGATVDLDSILGFGGGRQAGNGASPTRGRGRRLSLSGSAAGWCVAASPLPRPL
jgi:hypothetical protein